ncbi:hypothetical protein BKI52_36840 [marine bacterium AO1-C]|nr:hypothetical protein BKI52_36840 [marine bacterium AO1-C]
MKVIKKIRHIISPFALLSLMVFVLSMHTIQATPIDTIKAHRYVLKADSLMKHNQYVDAIVFWNQASGLYEKALRWQKNLHCKNQMTECWWRLGKLKEARGLAEKVLDLSERYLGPQHLVASVALNHLGVVEEMNGRRVEAIVNYQNALIIQKKRLGLDAVHPLLAKTYNNLGIISRIVNRYYQAEKYLNKAIDIEKKLKGEDATRVGLGYHNLGNVFHQKRAYSQALDYYYKANDIYQKKLPRLHVYKADNLNSMGQAFEQQGRFLDALIQFEKALKLYQQIHKIAHPDIAAVLSNLGECYFKINRYSKARLHHQKALRIYEKIYGQLHPRIAQGYLKLGNVLITQPQKNYYRAIRYFQRARNIQFKLYGKDDPLLAENYVYTGLAYVYQKNYQEALSWFQKSLVSNVYNFTDTTRLTNPSLDFYFDRKFFRDALYFKAECLYFLAKEKDDSQKLLLALETLRLCDRLTDRMQYDQQYRLDQLLAEKRNQNMYELAFSIAAQIALSYKGNRSLYRKFLEEAFYFSEKSKAQVLRKSMTQLENQRKNLLADTIRQTDLNYKQQIAFFEQKLAQRSQGAQAQGYRNQLFQLKQAYKHWSDSLQQQYPRLHALRSQASLVTLQQVQYRLYSKTAVIAYTLHQKQSYAFVITANQVHLVPLGSTERLIQQINQFYNEIQNESPLGLFTQASHKLYQLLVQPLMPYLGRQNELIITDPTLLSIPLEALVTRKPPQWVVQQGKFSLLTYLNRRFQLHYHYSVSLWWLGQKGYQNQTQNHSLKFYGFAPFNLLKKSASAAATNGFGQLPQSGREISSIARLFKTQRQSAYTYLSDNATLRQFRESLLDMPESDNIEHILHIASHSTANLREERLAKIHFAPQQHPDSTYLYAESIYYLPLKAQLVVLSSCESGVGKFAPGEGVMSLARGFLHAGAKNVISSLWEADDQYTKKLMVLLYQQILFRHKTYTQALHTAKNQLIAQEPYLHPKYWSNFILIGR